MRPTGRWRSLPSQQPPRAARRSVRALRYRRPSRYRAAFLPSAFRPGCRFLPKCPRGRSAVRLRGRARQGPAPRHRGRGRASPRAASRCGVPTLRGWQLRISSERSRPLVRSPSRRLRSARRHSVPSSGRAYRLRSRRVPPQSSRRVGRRDHDLRAPGPLPKRRIWVTAFSFFFSRPSSPDVVTARVTVTSTMKFKSVDRVCGHVRRHRV